jgi:hypothetical protein
VGQRLDEDELLAEFHKHRFINNKEPTALVSVSSRIVNTLSRALVKWRGIDEDEYQVESEPADETWIAFIAVPAEDSGIYYHHARALARQLEVEDPMLYQSEYVFEWKIPSKYILHTVSLQTLIDRGLDIERYIDGDGRPPSTDTLRDGLATYYFGYSTNEYETGLSLGFMARCFGARAPVLLIARRFIDEVYGRFRFKKAHRKWVDFEQLHEGIHTALIDWWLSDSDFVMEYRQHEEWASVLEDCMEQDYIFFDEDMYSDPVERDQELQEIEIRHKLMREDIERAAIELGL